MLLLHPVSLSVYPCRVSVSQRGLAICRVALPPRSDAKSAQDDGQNHSFEAIIFGPSNAAVTDGMLIPWRALAGFNANETETTPDGRRLQLLEVATHRGSLLLMGSAPAVSFLFRLVSRWSAHWKRKRSPLLDAATRLASVPASLMTRRHGQHALHPFDPDNQVASSHADSGAA